MADALPLTDLSFNLLVTLAGEELHGYALVKRLRQLEGRESLRTGTVYAALARLGDAGWIAEVDAPSEAADERRRYYRITEEGRSVARAEARRLHEVLDRARGRALLDPTGG